MIVDSLPSNSRERVVLTLLPAARCHIKWYNLKKEQVENSNRAE